jgi:hypothetical protein
MNCQWDSSMPDDAGNQGVCTNMDNGTPIDFHPCADNYFVRRNLHSDVDSVCQSLTPVDPQDPLTPVSCSMTAGDESTCTDKSGCIYTLGDPATGVAESCDPICNETGLCEYDTNTNVCLGNTSHDLIYDKCVSCIDQGSETDFNRPDSNIYKSGNCGVTSNTIDQSDSIYNYCSDDQNDNGHYYSDPATEVASAPCSPGDVCTLGDYYKKKVTCSNKSNWELHFGETPPAPATGVADPITTNTNHLYFDNSVSQCMGDIPSGDSDCNNWGQRINGANPNLSDANKKILCETHDIHRCIYRGPQEWETAPDSDSVAGGPTKFTLNKTPRELELDRHYKEVARINHNNYKDPICSSRWPGNGVPGGSLIYGGCIVDPTDHPPLTRSDTSSTSVNTPDLCKEDGYFLVGGGYSGDAAKCVQCGHDELHNYKMIDGECRRMFCFCNAYNSGDINSNSTPADIWSNIKQPEDVYRGARRVEENPCQEGLDLIKEDPYITMIEVCTAAPSVNNQLGSSRCTARDENIFYESYDITDPDCKRFEGTPVSCSLNQGDTVRGCQARTSALVPGVTKCHNPKHCRQPGAPASDPGSPCGTDGGSATAVETCAKLPSGSACSSPSQCSSGGSDACEIANGNYCTNTCCTPGHNGGGHGHTVSRWNCGAARQCCDSPTCA